MSASDNELLPAEFAEAASAAIADAQARDPKDTAAVLAEAGLCGVCVTESAGGLGLGIEFAVPVVAAAGRLRLQWPLLETLLVAGALGDASESAALASGARVATLAFGGSLQDGWAGHARHVGQAHWMLVADGQGGGALVDLAGIEVQEDAALDPEHPQAWMPLERAKVLAHVDTARYSTLQRDAQILVAALAHGAAEAALEMTVTHLSTRVQFGRPLSAKQAVRHHLSRMRLLQEAVAASIERMLHPDEFQQARDTRPVLAHALAHAALVLEKSIHLHGGMGFTWEVPLHYALREVRKFDAAFGSGALAQQVGREFIQAA